MANLTWDRKGEKGFGASLKHSSCKNCDGKKGAHFSVDKIRYCYARAPAAAAPAAASVLQNAVLGHTFLAGASMTLETFLEVGVEVPMIGPLMMVMLAFIQALDQHRANEEECERLAVWVHALMGSFAQAAKGMDAGSQEPLLIAAETALQKLKTLVDSRLDRTGGWLKRVKGFWTSKEFKESMELAERGLHDALDALLLVVSVQTRRDVARVLERAERLPLMEKNLEWIRDFLIAMNNKMDDLKEYFAHEVKQITEAIARTDAQAPPPAENYSAVFKLRPFSKEEWCARSGDPNKMDPVSRATLGKGAFGTTLRVELLAGAAHTGAQPGTLFAAKMIEEHELTTAGLSSAMVLREVDVLKRMQHPHIARFWKSYTERVEPFRVYYLVMELILCGSLADHVKLPGVLPEKLLKWMLQLASAMVYIHDIRVCHRDIKCENVMLGEGDQIKLIDFGLATVARNPSPETRNPKP